MEIMTFNSVFGAFGVVATMISVVHYVGQNVATQKDIEKSEERSINHANGRL